MYFNVLLFWWKDDPDMIHDEKAAGTRADYESMMKTEHHKPEKFRPQYKVHKIFKVRGKN